MHNLLCKVVLRNAFNQVSRRACCAALIDIDLLLDSWSRWSLAAAVPVVSEGYTFGASTGVLQGDPLSPALFCIALTPILQGLSTEAATRDIWYMDDGVLCAEPARVEKACVLRCSRVTLGQEDLVWRSVPSGKRVAQHRWVLLRKTCWNRAHYYAAAGDQAGRS